MLKWEKSLIGAKCQMPKYDLFPFPLVCKYPHLFGLPNKGKSIDLIDREKKKKIRAGKSQENVTLQLNQQKRLAPITELLPLLPLWISTSQTPK
jgi:hypothetical protein